MRRAFRALCYLAVGCARGRCRAENPGREFRIGIGDFPRYALTQQIKWAYLRYGPNDPVVWGTLNRVYGFAEAQGMAAAQSAPRAEYLRGLMLSASAPECLLPAQLEITDKLLALYAPLLEMAPAGGEDLPFWTDVQRSMVPLRASRMLQPGPGVRYFGAGRALAGLASLHERVGASPAPQADLGVGAPLERDDALELIGHLRKCWSPQAPERRHRRHAVKSRLGVVNGLAGAIEALDEEGSLSFDGGGAENWVVEPGTEPELLARILRETARTPLGTWIGVLRALEEHDNLERLEDLRVPTLVLWPIQDAFFPEEPDQRELRASLARAHARHGTPWAWKRYGRVPLPEAGPQDDLGHNLQWAAPEAVAPM